MASKRLNNTFEVHDWFQEQFRGWGRRLAPEQYAALLQYKNEGPDINEEMRDWNSGRFDDGIQLALTEAIASEELTESVRVYRGISDHDIAQLAYLYGDSLHHEGFVSVTLVESIARQFLTDVVVAEDGSDVRNILLIADLPVGTQVAPVDLLPTNYTEAEMILHAGSRFEIERVDDSDLDAVLLFGTWRAP